MYCIVYSSTYSQSCPSGILLQPHLSTGVAFDNFDRFVETSNGKDTPNDTVGIIFQFVESSGMKRSEDLSIVLLEDDGQGKVTENESDLHFDVTESSESLSQTVSAVAKSSSVPQLKNINNKRRAFDAILPDLPSYPKKPRMIESLLPLHTLEKDKNPKNMKSVLELDFLWMLSHALKIPNTPMYVGFNSRLHIDDASKQRISYLTPINSSPTNTAVVLQALI